jgi:hypothetical protein
MGYTEPQWEITRLKVDTFIQDYCQKCHVTEVHYRTGANGSLNFGVLVSTDGLLKLYYITVESR